MKIQVHLGISLAFLASGMLLTASAQSAKGNQAKNGNKASTSTAQTNNTNGQRKDGQVVHQDFGQVKASRPNTLTTAVTPANTQGGTGEATNGNGAANSKIKVRQEFGPTQASKRNDVAVPQASGANGGKPGNGSKAQTPR